MDFDPPTPSPDPIQNPSSKASRCILTRLQQLIVVFPSSIVSEILIVNRAHLLSLPFYHPAVLGIVRQSGRLVPLISVYRLLGKPEPLASDTLTVICLARSLATAAGAGLVVDNVVGSTVLDNLEDLPKLNSSADLFSPSSEQIKSLFDITLLSEDLWQPARLTRVL